MIDRIETQQQDHQQYTERKQYKAIGAVSAIPATNRTYLEWVELDKSLPRQEPRTYLQVQSTDVEKCGYHVIHDEGKPTERHEWLLKEHFDSAYCIVENHGNSDDEWCKGVGGDAPIDLSAGFKIQSGALEIPYTKTLTVYVKPMTNIEYRDWVFKQKNLAKANLSTPVKCNQPSLKWDSSNPKDGAMVTHNKGTKSEYCEWLSKDDLNRTYRGHENHGNSDDHQQGNHTDDELLNAYSRYVKAHDAIPGDTTSPLTYDEFIDIANIEDWLAGSKDGVHYNREGVNERFKEKDLSVYKPNTGNSAQASKCDAVTDDIRDSLKAQFNKIKDTGDKTQLKQEIDRAQAMISLAQSITALK